MIIASLGRGIFRQRFVNPGSSLFERRVDGDQSGRADRRSARLYRLPREAVLS